MQLIKIIKQQKPFKYNIGDFEWWTDYIAEFTEQDIENNEVLPLNTRLMQNPWAIMKCMPFDQENLRVMRKTAMYSCPFDEKFVFYGAIPLVVFSDNIDKYRTEYFSNEEYDIYFDSEWTKGMNCRVHDMHTGAIRLDFPFSSCQRAYMGHGFTNCTLPSDGSNRIVSAKIELSNGDWLGIKTWLWFNK